MLSLGNFALSLFFLHCFFPSSHHLTTRAVMNPSGAEDAFLTWTVELSPAPDPSDTPHQPDGYQNHCFACSIHRLEPYSRCHRVKPHGLPAHSFPDRCFNLTQRWEAWQCKAAVYSSKKSPNVMTRCLPRCLESSSKHDFSSRRPGFRVTVSAHDVDSRQILRRPGRVRFAIVEWAQLTKSQRFQALE